MAVMVEVFTTPCILLMGIVVGDASVLISCCFENVSVQFLMAKLDIGLGWACRFLCSSPGVAVPGCSCS